MKKIKGWLLILFLIPLTIYADGDRLYYQSVDKQLIAQGEPKEVNEQIMEDNHQQDESQKSTWQKYWEKGQQLIKNDKHFLMITILSIIIIILVIIIFLLINIRNNTIM